MLSIYGNDGHVAPVVRQWQARAHGGAGQIPDLLNLARGVPAPGRVRPNDIDRRHSDVRQFAASDLHRSRLLPGSAASRATNELQSVGVLYWRAMVPMTWRGPWAQGSSWRTAQND